MPAEPVAIACAVDHVVVAHSTGLICAFAAAADGAPYAWFCGGVPLTLIYSPVTDALIIREYVVATVRGIFALKQRKTGFDRKTSYLRVEG